MSLLILTGASGAGKTTVCKELARSGAFQVLHFDSIEVPSFETMVAEFGSPEAWQRAKTLEWFERLKREHLPRGPVLFEGQMRISFIEEALRASGIDRFEIVLVDCDDTTRKRRLTIDRGQPELADQNMMNWAAYLRKQATASNARVLDTSDRAVNECARELEELLRQSAALA